MKDYITGILILFALSGCYYDNEEELYPAGGNCDTTAITYSGHIQPIISSRCYSCHSQGAAPGGGGNVNLENLGVVQSYANNGKLTGVINHAPGFKKMPQNAPKIPDCEIAKIERWVQNGAQDN